MNWSTLRDSYIRVELGDTDSTSYRWSDAELLSYAAMGIRDISKHMPVVKSQTITSVSGQRNYNLASDRVGAVLRVEHPEGVWLEEYSRKPGTKKWYPIAPEYLVAGYTVVGQGWYEMDNVLYLSQDPDTESDIVVDYEGQRDIPSGDSSVVDLLDNDLELLIVFVCFKCHLRQFGKDANLSRWSDKGRRDDSPLEPAWRAYKDQYDEMLAERQPLDPIRLFRIGRL